MNKETEYIEVKRKSWNKRTEAHYNSKFYDVEAFLQGNSSLHEIELGLLGDVRNKRILHLQCHFVQDTLSLSRMGAIVTGVDLSDKAIDRARELTLRAGLEATFICSDIYELEKHLDGEFDIVFTSYGTIGWLPDLDRWGKLISRYLKPGGQLVCAEFHPVVWMFDDQFSRIAYSYFNTGPILESEEGTYADRTAPISQEYVMWNHSMSEVITNLIQSGLELQSFHEFDYSPHNCFLETTEVAPKQFQVMKHEGRIPMVYALSARKKASR